MDGRIHDINKVTLAELNDTLVPAARYRLSRATRAAAVRRNT
jgi:hypothetical protein